MGWDGMGWNGMGAEVGAEVGGGDIDIDEDKGFAREEAPGLGLQATSYARMRPCHFTT